MSEATRESPVARYRGHLAAGELVYQWSPAAGKAVFYPRVLCPFTGSTDLEWRIAGGGGTVYSASTVFPRDGEPYSVALIDCDEGFRLMSRVIDIDPAQVAIGQRVQLVVAPLEPEGEPLPLFRPVES